jgi:Carbohydrate family 9 binding domain-like
MDCRRAELHDLTADQQTAPWRDLPASPLLHVVTGKPPDQGTEVRTAWDADELRVLFCAIDAHPWATLTQRDAPLYTEEVLEIFLDPVGDLQSYFEFEVNPLNAVLDLVIRRNRSGLLKDFTWRCAGLRTAVLRTELGWNAEFSIPFRSLIAEPPPPGAQWRVNFCRIDRPDGKERELSAWAPTGQPRFHLPERFGHLTFLAS